MQEKKAIILSAIGCLFLLGMVGSVVVRRVDVDSWTRSSFSYERPLNDEADKFIERYRIVKRIEPGFSSFDLWGTRLNVWEKDNRIFVQSAGPDTNFDTNDDFYFSKELPVELLDH